MSHTTGVAGLAEREADRYDGLLTGDHAAFRDYLIEDITEAIDGDDDYEDPALLQDAVQEAGHDAVKHYREQRREGAADVFRDVDPEAVWDESIQSVYKEEVLEGVAVAAVEYLEEQGHDVEDPRGVELRFSPSTASYDWQNDVVRIGEQEPRIEYKPAMFGMMVHELYHKKQFADKVEAGVRSYNDLVSGADVGLEKVPDDDEQYVSHGLMMHGSGEMVHSLIDRVEEEGSKEAEDRLQAAVEEEFASYRYEPGDPFEIEDPGRHVGLFGPEDEVVPHLLYLEAEGLTDPAEIEEYLVEVVRENKGGAMIEAEMRDRLGL